MRYLLIGLLLLGGCATKPQTIRLEVVYPNGNKDISTYDKLSHNKKLIFQAFKVNIDGMDYEILATWLLSYNGEDIEEFLYYVRTNYLTDYFDWAIDKQFNKVRATYEGLKYEQDRQDR